jgi:hypothetical protein
VRRVARHGLHASRSRRARRAIAASELEVEVAGRRVKFDSFDGLKKRRDYVADQLQAQTDRAAHQLPVPLHHLAGRLMRASTPSIASSATRPGARAARRGAHAAAARLRSREPARHVAPRRGGASAQADHMADATKLRAKARALVQNVPVHRASMDALVDNVVGTGIVPRFTGPYAKKLNDAVAQWAPECDADGRSTSTAWRPAAYRAMEQDGEVLVRLRPRRLADGLAVPLQLQLLEIDWLDSTRNSLLGGSPDVAPGNVVIEGIEYDPLGRVAAYWLWDQHPGDVTVLRRHAQLQQARAGVEHHPPVRSEAAWPGARHHAPGARHRAHARPAAVRRRGDRAQEPGDAPGRRRQRRSRRDDNPIERRTPRILRRRAQDRRPRRAASGGIIECRPAPAAHHDRAQARRRPRRVRRPAAAHHHGGARRHVRDGHRRHEQVNFSSARVRLQDVRRGFERTQWHLLMPRWCSPLADAFVAAAKDAGKVPRVATYGVEFDTPKWDYVNPLQEAQADALQVASGLTSSARSCARAATTRKRCSPRMQTTSRSSRARRSAKGVSVLDVLFFLQKGTLRITDQSDERGRHDRARRGKSEARKIVSRFAGNETAASAECGLMKPNAPKKQSPRHARRAHRLRHAADAARGADRSRVIQRRREHRRLRVDHRHPSRDVR